MIRSIAMESRSEYIMFFRNKASSVFSTFKYSFRFKNMLKRLQAMTRRERVKIYKIKTNLETSFLVQE